MDAAETTAQTTILDVVHGFGLSFSYSSVEVAEITTIVVVVLAEWVISLVATAVTTAIAAVNGLLS